MKRKIIFLFLIFFAFAFSSSFENSKHERDEKSKSSLDHLQTGILIQNQPWRFEGPRYVQDEILVKFKETFPEQKIQAAMAAYKFKEIDRIPRIDVYTVKIPEGTTVEEMVFVMKENPNVEYAEPNYIAHIAVTPNDTLFKYQYALFNSGQRVAPVDIPGAPTGKQRADIKATSAWEETKGNEEVVIAIVDTGVDLRHSDIKNRMTSSGYDYVNKDFDATDDHGHGTHVAGIAGADTDNDEGVAGATWECKILPVKVMDKDGSGEVDWVSKGIIYAADMGASVINLSIGGPEPSQTLLNAIKYAYEKDIVIISAVGNEGGPVLYPAAYDGYVLAVAATDYNDSRPDWSNFGPEVDVAAPGDWIISLWPMDLTPPRFAPYAWAEGTSMSAAYVTGLASLIKSIKPWLKASEIMDIIRFTADDVNSIEHPGKDEFIGYGRINMDKALVPIKIKK